MKEVSTYIPVGIGRGTKTHDLHATVRWNARKGRVGIYTGQTYCGSQRGLSGWYAKPLGTTPTCERCGVRRHEDREYSTGRQVGDPTKVLTASYRTLTALPDIAEEVSPGPDDACEDYEVDWSTRTRRQCSLTGRHGSTHRYDREVAL